MKAPTLALLAAALAAGCAITPEAGRQIDQARAAYEQAASDAAVRQYAPHELQHARAALQDAERMAGEGDSTRAAHGAYVAERRALAAQAAAGARKAAVDLAQAQEARRSAELLAARDRAQRAEARLREIEEERQRAAQAQEQAQAQAKEQEKTAAAELGAEAKRIEAEHPQVSARETERGWVLSLGGATLFEQGAMLSPGADRTLDDVAGFLRKHPERGVAVEGFAEGERLSERRAQAVKFALVQRGVEAYRIDARGRGLSDERRVDVLLK
jgi:outer membrane protein OmpA-like peptidoglycan-associated protein